MDRLKLKVYSVHTETMILSKEKRMNQANSVLKSSSDYPEHIIIGGDFNTVFLHNIRDIETLFNKHGFIRASKSAGPTVDKGPIELTLDHIFAKGFQVVETGTLKTEASDHRPLWAILKPILPEKSHP